MIQKIKPEYFETELFKIKETKEDKLSIMFVDFQYSSPATNSQNNYPTISSGVFTKYVTLDSMAITIPSEGSSLSFSPTGPLVNISDMLLDELNKKFIEIISDLGEKNRELAHIKNFDINISDMKKKQMDISRGIIAKIHNISNYIATQGRIGPAQYIISNYKTYSYILKYLGNVNILFKNNELWIGNIKYIIDINNNVEEDTILIGRKNSIDQPGVHCLILTDENGDILFDEFVEPINYTKTYIMYYKIVELGFHPQSQYYKIKTRDITYYRNLKLQRIKELYGN
jgi:hypothetical protein